jgi:hypothetical protein
MIFSDNIKYKKSLCCKFCNARFHVFNKYWCHKEKCEIETKLTNKINAAYEKLEEEKEKERKKEKEIKEMNDEYAKIVGTFDCRVENLLERIQNVRKKIRTEIIDLKYDEKAFDMTRNRIQENRKKLIEK